MRTILSGALLLLLSFPLFSQTEIGGVINIYAKVVDIDPCSAILTTSSTPIYGVGDEILLIQMQGAEINESNSDNFGDVTDLGSAGLFERNEIVDIVGSQVFLKYNLEHNYDVSGSIQLVDIPSFSDAIVTETLSAFPWNGSIGGVLALRANTLILDENIDLSEQGFRGGEVNPQSSDCNFFTNADAYHYSLSNWRGAPKGEGIAVIIEGKEQGRGPQANGGGGGNDHNSGGGGGANVSPAGEGGRQSVGGFGCDGDYPGERGKAIDEVPDRIFMGGGGGAGHVDNVNAGTAGGNGGGIAFLLADEIIANGFSILSNGETPNEGAAAGDGQGGGGAGGSIYLDANNATGLHIEAIGGNGGNANNPSDRCFGPGGGGSGGRLISSISVVDVDLSGGQPGVNVNSSSQCSDPSNSADAGDDGIISDFENIPFSNVEVSEVEVLAQPENQTACEEGQVTFNFVVGGPGLNYLWQYNDGSGWQDVMPGALITGFNTPSLTFFQINAAMDGWQVRCLVTGACTNDILSFEAELNVIPALMADFSSANIGGGTVQFTNLSSTANAYLWDFGDTFTSMDENPEHTYVDFGTYTVTLTIFTDCGELTVSQMVTVATPPTAGFTADLSSGCVPLSVQFFDQSANNPESWEWLFPGGFPATSSDENPNVLYPDAGTYDVVLIATNTEGSDTLTLSAFVEAEDVPVLDFDVTVDMLNVQFLNLSQNVVGDFMWDFGDTFASNEVSPEHDYTSSGFFDVTLTASNDCGESSVTQTIATGQFPLASFSSQSSGGCAPIVVAFTDFSNGSNLSNWEWQFEGGIPSVSSEQNPVVTYSEPGIYDVTLTVFNSFGEHTTVEENYIVVEAVPQPDFNFSVNGFAVGFANTSVGGTSYQWNFDDGEISTEISPLHVYNESGIYTVTLTAIEENCASSIAYDVFVEIPSEAGEADFKNAINIFPNPTNGQLFIQLPYVPLNNFELRLHDINGRSFLSEKINSAEYSLDISELNSGIYFMEIINEGEVAVFRVVRS